MGSQRVRFTCAYQVSKRIGTWRGAYPFVKTMEYAANISVTVPEILGGECTPMGPYEPWLTRYRGSMV